MPSITYTLVSDNDGHDYIIPARKLKDWEEWLNIPEDDERSWDVPPYANKKEGEYLLFKQYCLTTEPEKHII